MKNWRQTRTLSRQSLEPPSRVPGYMLTALGDQVPDWFCDKANLAPKTPPPDAGQSQLLIGKKRRSCGGPFAAPVPSGLLIPELALTRNPK